MFCRTSAAEVGTLSDGRNLVSATMAENVPVISCYMDKGGVGKSAAVRSLGHALAYCGLKVLLADMDRQCDLSKSLLDVEGADYQEYIQREFPQKRRTVKQMLAPGVKNGVTLPARNEPGDAGDTFKITLSMPCVAGGELHLLAGDMTLDDPLAHVLSDSDAKLTNKTEQLDEDICTPGEIVHTLQRTANKLKADCILVDLQPNKTIVHSYLLFSSHYILVPARAEKECLNKVTNIAPMLESWLAHFKTQIWPMTRRAPRNPWPETRPKLLGYLLWLPGESTSAKRFRQGALLDGWDTKNRKWLSSFEKAFAELRKELLPKDLVLKKEAYEALGKTLDLTMCLGVLPDCTDLEAVARERLTAAPFVQMDELTMEVEGCRTIWAQVAWNLLQLIKSSNGNGTHLSRSVHNACKLPPPASDGHECLQQLLKPPIAVELERARLALEQEVAETKKKQLQDAESQRKDAFLALDAEVAEKKKQLEDAESQRRDALQATAHAKEEQNAAQKQHADLDHKASAAAKKRKLAEKGQKLAEKAASDAKRREQTAIQGRKKAEAAAKKAAQKQQESEKKERAAAKKLKALLEQIKKAKKEQAEIKTRAKAAEQTKKKLQTSREGKRKAPPEQDRRPAPAKGKQMNKPAAATGKADARAKAKVEVKKAKPKATTKAAPSSKQMKKAKAKSRPPGASSKAKAKARQKRR